MQATEQIRFQLFPATKNLLQKAQRMAWKRSIKTNQPGMQLFKNELFKSNRLSVFHFPLTLNTFIAI